MYSKYKTDFFKVGYKQNLKMNITYNKYKYQTNIKQTKYKTHFSKNKNMYIPNKTK